MDDREVIFERGGLHPRVNAGESAAHVDHVDHDAGLADRNTRAFQRLDIGERRHRLTADVKTDAEPVGILAARLQQPGGLRQIAAEFAGEAQFGVFAGNAQAHAQAQVLGQRPVLAGGRGDDLLQLFDRIEAEGADAMLEIGFADGAGRLDRMHEAQRRFRQGGAHQPHFGDGRDVVMRNAVVPQDLDQIGRGIGLHRIQRLARKLLFEESGSARGGVRAIDQDRLVRRQGADYRPCVRKTGQFKGPPNGSFHIRCHAVWKSPDGRGRAAEARI